MEEQTPSFPHRNYGYGPDYRLQGYKVCTGNDRYRFHRRTDQQETGFPSLRLRLKSFTRELRMPWKRLLD